MEKTIESFTYEDEMKESFRDYAVSVIMGRALPDVRDGFKPVQRRVLYAMRNLGILPDTPYKKSARIVGEVIGKYHPHGDAAAYDTMVRLAQDFRLNVPLVDGHGNFGSIDGDSAAAMRYTEARLAPASMMLLSDLEKNIVDFRDNYDGTEREPVVLPAQFPQLLVNGTLGIAVGMRSNIPPHNFTEVIDAFLLYLNHPKAPLSEFLKVLPGPDFPTGGIIINPTEFQKFYETGEAKAVIRSKIKTEPSSYGKTNIVITEIPYPLAGNKGKLVSDLTRMVMDKKFKEITDVRDESSKDGIRIVLEVKKGIDIDKFLNKLFTKTNVEMSESYQFLTIVDGRPKQLGLKEYFHHYLLFQKELTRRKYQDLYKKGMERKEVLEGLIQAVDDIDAIIDTIRGSQTVAQMKRCLIHGNTEGIQFRMKKHERIAQKFRFTERQAKAILDMKLQRLGKLEMDSLKKELEELTKDLAKAKMILEDDHELIKEIRREHRKLKKLLSSERKTVLKEVKRSRYVEEKKIEDIWVAVDRFGYAKTFHDDATNVPKEAKFRYFTKDNDYLVVFTNKGNFYQIKLDDIPRGKKKDKGVTIHALAKLNRGEFPVFVTVKSHLEKKDYLFVTRSGLTKRTKGEELVTNRKKMIGTRLKTNDELLAVMEVNTAENMTIVFVSKLGYTGKIPLNEFPVQSKAGRGIQSLSLKDEDEVEAFYVIQENEEVDLMIHGRVVSTKSIPVVNRGTRGNLIK